MTIFRFSQDFSVMYLHGQKGLKNFIYLCFPLVGLSEQLLLFLETFVIFQIFLRKIDLISPILSLILLILWILFLSMLKMGLNEYSPTLHILMIIPF